MAKQHDSKWTVDCARGRILRREGGGGQWLEGVVATPLGYVMVQSERGYTTLGAIVGGVEHSRTIGRDYSRLGLVRVAHRYIKELHEQQGERDHA